MAFSNIKLKEGDVLFVEGELITEFFIIKKGEVKIIKERQGRLSIIRNLVTGDFIGEVAMFTGEKLRGATVIALTPCDIIKIPKTDLMAVLDSKPPWVFEIMKDLTNKLQLSGQIMKDQAIHRDEVTRNIEILTPIMEGKYLNAIEDYRRKKGIFIQK